MISTVKEAAASCMEWYYAFCNIGKGNEKSVLELKDAAILLNTITDHFEAAQPKWISVEERLPEFETLVLVAVNGKWESFTFVNALQMATLYKDEGWIIEGFEEWDKPVVTHWMPAPDMP